MRVFHEIPEDHCAPRAPDGVTYLMADTRQRSPKRGRVFAKAFGRCPEVVTAVHARREGMLMLGKIVGTYPNGRAQAVARRASISSRSEKIFERP